MLRWVSREDEDVIQVDEDKAVQEVTDNVIHEGLEHCRSVGEAEGQYSNGQGEF